VNESEYYENRGLAPQLISDRLSDVEKGTDQIGRDTLAFANGIHC